MSKREFTFHYKVRNWAEYNRALIHRGELTLWIDEAAVGAWKRAVLNRMTALGMPESVRVF